MSGNQKNPTQSEIANEINRVLSNDKILTRSFIMVISTSVVFGLVGGLIGCTLAALTPAYFRDVYDTLESEVWQVAIGMGISRGLICGVIAGSSVLLATAWYRSRIKNAIVDQFK